MGQLKAVLALLLASAIWGLSFPMTQIALGYFDEFSVMALRMTIAAIALGCMLLFQDKKIKSTAVRKGLFLGVLLFLGLFLQTEGLRYTSSTNSAFITALQIILIPIILFAVYSQKPSQRVPLAAVVSIIGLLLLTRPDLRMNLGDAITLACAVIFSLYTLYTARFSRGENLIHLLAPQFAIGAVLGWAAIFAFGKMPAFGNATALAGVVYLGLVSSATAFFLKTYALRFIDAARGALINASEPLFATAFAFIILGDRLNLSQATGAMLVLASIIYIETENRAERGKAK